MNQRESPQVARSQQLPNRTLDAKREKKRGVNHESKVVMDRGYRPALRFDWTLMQPVHHYAREEIA